MVAKKETKKKNEVPESLFAEDAERGCLGAILLNNEVWEELGHRLKEEIFYSKRHQMILKSILRLAHANRPFDTLTVIDDLRNHKLLEEVGGESYLYEMIASTPSVHHAKMYAQMVHDKSVLRSLSALGQDMTHSAYHPEGKDASLLLSEAEHALYQLSTEQDTRTGPQGIEDILAITSAKIDKLSQSKNAITGTATGYNDLDRMTAGLQESDLMIVAGRPSMGKTSFAMNIAEHVAIKGDDPVVIFSLEMPSDMLVMRMLSSLGRVSQQRVRTGQLKDEDWPRLTSAMGMMSKANLYIDDTPALSPSQALSRSRRIARKHGGKLGLVIIDYLQLMQVPGFREGRTLEISEISRSLKIMAKELKVPVIALSQLNRSLEQRQDRRPVMSDLRESGAIEQDADVIAFIYRDEVYHEDSADKGLAEIIIGKQRNGPIGKIRLTFLGEYTRFESFTEDVYA